MSVLGLCVVLVLPPVLAVSAHAGTPLTREETIPVLESTHRPGLEPATVPQEAAALQYPETPAVLPPPGGTSPAPKTSDLVAGALHFGVLGAFAGAAAGLLVEKKGWSCPLTC